MLYDSDKPLYDIQMDNANESCEDMHKAARKLKISVDAIVQREIVKPDDLYELSAIITEEAQELVLAMAGYARDQEELDNTLAYISERNRREMGVGHE